MTVVVYLPIFLSVLMVPVCRIVASHVPPRTAARAIVGATVAAAAAATGSIALLAWSLVARVPQVATKGHWRAGDVGRVAQIPLPVGAVAAIVAAVILGRMARVGLRAVCDRSDLVDIHRSLRSLGSERIVVLIDPAPSAYAVAPVLGHPARIVLTDSLVGVLTDSERNAVIAHENEHLTGRHRWLLLAFDLAVAANPWFNPLRSDLAFILERCADETASKIAGRHETVTAISRCALAHLSATQPAHRPTVTFAIRGSKLTDRVLALTTPPCHRRWLASLVCVAALTAIVSVAWASHTTERTFENLISAADGHNG